MTAQKGRNVVPPPQTHSQAGPTATTWTKWCPRRVYPRSNRPKPPETSEAGPNAAAKPSLRGDRLALQFTAATVADGLLQRNRPEGAIAARLRNVLVRHGQCG